MMSYRLGTPWGKVNTRMAGMTAAYLLMPWGQPGKQEGDWPWERWNMLGPGML